MLDLKFIEGYTGRDSYYDGMYAEKINIKMIGIHSKLI